jgi:hypothetical protein
MTNGFKRYAATLGQIAWKAALVSVLVVGIWASFSTTPSHVIGGFVSILSGLALGFVARS